MAASIAALSSPLILLSRFEIATRSCRGHPGRPCRRALPGLAGLDDDRVSAVLEVDELAALPCPPRRGPRRRASSLDLVLRQAAGVGDLDVGLLAVALSVAVTVRMPLASRANSTSICGMPRGAGAMPDSSNWPSVRLSLANSRSPWRTWISRSSGCPPRSRRSPSCSSGWWCCAR
jgi:hypothetical protein